MKKKFSLEDLGGMTVNERLYHLGLFQDYDQAVDAQDPERLRAVLSHLHIGTENIEAIIKTKITK
jgi:hypothetical protein